jgi:hypothetical protein
MMSSIWSAPAERSGDGALDQTTNLIQSGVALCLPPHSKKQKPLHPNQKDGTVTGTPAELIGSARIPVSPFDGANRIRFKGSLALPIFNCQLPIVF